VRDEAMDSARRIGLEVDVQRLPCPAAMVEQAAAAVGCVERRIVSSTVFVADGDAVLCMTCGSDPVDGALLADALDVAEVRPATRDEVRAATGFAAGGVPPFGHELPIVLDEAVFEHETVWAAGGDGRSVFEVEPRHLASCTEATVATLARHPARTAPE
jgi:prolyl-tRNA editing enzyme YbaK/EbsC (Cys-tRNA(Pro) deacylase)